MLLIAVALLAVGIGLARRIDRLERRIYDLERQLENRPAGEDAVSRRTVSSVHPSLRTTGGPAEVPDLAPPDPKRGAHPADASRSGKGGDAERFIGGNLIARVGILVLILGIGFFVKYAADNDWIGRTARIATGYAAGLALIATGIRLRVRYRIFSSVLVGGGFAVMIVTTAIASHYYQIMSTGAAMGILAAVSALLVVVSLLTGRRETAVTAVVGGFAAPLLAVGGAASQTFLLAYAAAVLLCACIIGAARRWSELTAAATLSAYIVALVFVVLGCLNADGIGRIGIVHGFDTLFLLIVAATVALHRRGGRRDDMLLCCTVLANNAAYLFIAAVCADFGGIEWHTVGVSALLAGVADMVSAVRLESRDERSGACLMVLYAAGTAAVTAGFAIAVENGDMLRVVLACEAVALCLMARSRKIFVPLTLAVLSIACLLALHGGHAGFDPCGFGSRLAAVAAAGVCAAIAARTAALRRLTGILAAVAAVVAYFVVLGQLTALLPADGYTARTSVKLLFTTGWLLLVGATLGRVFDTAGRAVFGAVVVGASVSACAVWHCSTAVAAWCSAAAAAATVVITMSSFYRMPVKRVLRTAMTVWFNAAIIALLLVATARLFASAYATALSVVLILVGTVQMIWGMAGRSRTLRSIALAVYAATIVKLVSYDIWLLPPVGRIAVSVLLGVILLVVAFVYNRRQRSVGK